MPLVSVIVPNYNHADFLNQRLESVFTQTFQDFEVIILDDRSTDNSAQVIERYKHHPRVSHVVINETNSGSTFRQWAKGISLASGEYIWIAESDDWCEPTFLYTTVAGLQADPSSVVAYCQSYCIINTNEIKWQSAYPLLQDYQKGAEFIHKHMLNGNAIFNASMAVWKKEIFKKISPEFTTYTFCGDWLFWIELCTHGTVFISGKLLNYFRKHNKDVSGKAYESGLNFREEVRMMNYLHAAGLIQYGQYLETLKSKFLIYQLTKPSLPQHERATVEELFFSHPGIKSKLTGYYNKWITKHRIKTWLTRPFSAKK